MLFSEVFRKLSVTMNIFLSHNTMKIYLKGLFCAESFGSNLSIITEALGLALCWVCVELHGWSKRGSFPHPAWASSIPAGWIVLGAAMVSHLVAEPEFKCSLAISFLTCGMLCRTHEMKYPSIVCYFLFYGWKGEIKVVWRCCAASVNTEKRPEESTAQDQGSWFNREDELLINF